MSSPFVAEIRIFGFNFPPTGWAFCDGQLMPISQNTALFSLLGTTYGGDGKSTFALPDMQGNAPMQPGQGSGLSDRFLGETAGEQFVTLNQSEMPAQFVVAAAPGRARAVRRRAPHDAPRRSRPRRTHRRGADRARLRRRRDRRPLRRQRDRRAARSRLRIMCRCDEPEERR